MQAGPAASAPSLLPPPAAASARCQRGDGARVEPASWQGISPNDLTSALPGFAANPSFPQVRKEAWNVLFLFAAQQFGTGNRQTPTMPWETEQDPTLCLWLTEIILFYAEAGQMVRLKKQENICLSYFCCANENGQNRNSFYNKNLLFKNLPDFKLVLKFY